MDQSDKFKPLRESVPPLIELSKEVQLAMLEQKIPQTELCRMVREVVFALDTSEIESRYSFDGQKSYHPKLMLCLFFFGYASGVRSSRQLARKCRRDDHFKYLMHLYTPDHRTISDFRKNHYLSLVDYFVDVLRLFQKLGYTKVGEIYLDGSKMKACASAKQTKTAQELQDLHSALEAGIYEKSGII